MNREELRDAMSKYIKHPENIQDEILDKYGIISDLKLDDLERSVTPVIDEDVKLWQFIKKQSELLYLLKSLDVIQSSSNKTGIYIRNNENPILSR